MTLVLVVDDNPDDQEFVADMLCGKADGFAVECVETGREGIERFDQGGVDCILLDYRLEAEDGTVVLQELKARDPYFPIILMSGQGTETVAATALKTGASDYLVKSQLSSTQLRQAIQNGINVCRLQRELADKERELQRANRLDALGQLAAGIAHDFNNLLATIQYLVSGVLRDPLPERSRLHLKSVLETIERSAELSRRLISFAADQPATASTRRVKQIVADFEALFRPVSGRRINVEVKTDDPDALVYCDQSELDNALLNVAINARDAIVDSRVGDRIQFDIRSLQGQREDDRAFVEFVFEDNGPGMPKEVLERATDPYFTTKDRGRGTGLGLATVYAFAKKSCGMLTIDTTLGIGTTVRILLPRASGNNIHIEPNLISKDASSEHYRILVVDDEVLLLMSLGEILSDFGHEVYEAASAKEALDIVDARHEIDLVITDVHMPGGMSGFELASAIRDKLPDTGILYMSGYTGYDDAEMGAIKAPVMTKPCAPEQIPKYITQALQS